MLKKTKRSVANNSAETIKHESLSMSLGKTENVSQLVYKITVEKKGLVADRSQ